MKKFVVYAVISVLIQLGVSPVYADANTSWLDKLLNSENNEARKTQRQSIEQRGRDPFAVSKLMLEILQGKQREDGGSEFNVIDPADSEQTFPVLKLNGFLKTDKNEFIALLKVGNAGTFLVRAGDTLSLQSIGQSTVLKIESINRLSVLVSIGTFGKQIIVR